MPMKSKLILAVVLLAISITPANAQDLQGDELKSMVKSTITSNSTVKKDFTLKLPEKVVRQWQDLKFGMFIHWGLYSIRGHGEWAMFNEKIDAEEYAQQANAFNPQRFDADKWASIAKMPV